MKSYDNISAFPCTAAKMEIFYLIFYCILHSGFTGLVVWPNPEEFYNDTSLIWFVRSKPEKYQPWINQLDRFLGEYLTSPLVQRRDNNIQQNCDYDNPPTSGQVCDVNVQNWQPCITENLYGYQKGSPCFFFKLDKIYGWIPEFYNNTEDLPDKMPLELKNHIRGITQASKRNTVWVSCQGEQNVDEENIGPIEYIPNWGFPGYFYPYNNTEGYLSPLVAVHFVSPQIGVIINIQCKVWAKDINYNTEKKLGSVYFELLID